MHQDLLYLCLSDFFKTRNFLPKEICREWRHTMSASEFGCRWSFHPIILIKQHLASVSSSVFSMLVAGVWSVWVGVSMSSNFYIVEDTKLTFEWLYMLCRLSWDMFTCFYCVLLLMKWTMDFEGYWKHHLMLLSLHFLKKLKGILILLTWVNHACSHIPPRWFCFI